MDIHETLRLWAALLLCKPGARGEAERKGNCGDGPEGREALAVS